jgi:hypothetical protein
MALNSAFFTNWCGHTIGSAPEPKFAPYSNAFPHLLNITAHYDEKYT